MNSSFIIPKALSLFGQQRTRMYRLLAAVCDRPADEATLDILCRLEASPEVFQSHLSALVAGGLKKIRAWRDGSGNSLAEAMLPLAGEFTQLFRGIRRSDSCPPAYESVYLDGGVLYGASTEGVLQFYQHLELASETNEPPDYIALELDFMGHLCEKESAAWEENGAAQEWLGMEREFLREHLAKWVPKLTETIRANTTSGFYRGLADLLEGWVFAEVKLAERLLAASTIRILPG